MKKLVKLKIDVKKIDKSRLFTGAKGVYLDAEFWLNEDPDKYGHHGMITQEISKEEREDGVQGAILGNAKVFLFDDKKSPQSQPSTQQAPPQEDDDDIPF